MIYWVGNTIHNNVAHLCTSRGTFLRINGKTTLSPLDATTATLHLTIFGIWGNNIQSVQYVICVMIMRGLWYIGLAIRYTIMLRIYVHHGAPFCVLTVKRHCLPLTRLPRVAGGAPAVNHKATAIWLALRILAGNEHCNVCDGNMVSEYIFNFFMATYEWMHPKYVCRICNYLFCIHAKFYKHISPSYYKPDAQSLKFYWRCSYWIFP